MESLHVHEQNIPKDVIRVNNGSLHVLKFLFLKTLTIIFRTLADRVIDQKAHRLDDVHVIETTDGVSSWHALTARRTGHPWRKSSPFRLLPPAWRAILN